MVLAPLACALTCGAAGVMFYAWRRPGPTPLASLCGWLMLLVASGLWSYRAGAEFGISFTLITLALAAWSIIVLSADHRLQKTKPQVRDKLRLARFGTMAYQLWRLLAVVLLAGVVSVALLVAMGKLLPLSAVNAMVLAALLSPLLWGLAGYWLLADPRPARPPIVLLLAGLASGAVILL
ncbi:hypothetical protein [Gilvimarinus sp. DA14]|uniref:hypothetical protein n=1 Tax=Gilvimarinus sp. DA14 TaxID=2956798 RepID=UPI0020B65160|nr:hypothetical protein [Gilvimarinus sp. DA14]UTF61546.1 hypothetical protein NHM04_07050 [Gilvimarinus sp. DA14]